METYNHGLPPVPVLVEYLKRAITRCSHVYILLDALDESPIDASREQVLSIIETMRSWKLPGLHLLVTSRDVSDIRDCVQFEGPRQHAEHIWLNNNNVQQDISDYVLYQVENDPQLPRWSKNHREKIQNYLFEHADGVFRWVEFQLRPLWQCARSKKQLEKCLRSLPQTLDATYERILSGIGEESREEAQQILSLLCFATRPLSVDEVIEASAIDIDDPERYDVERRFTDIDDLLRICPGLIEVGALDPDEEDNTANGNSVSLEEDEGDVGLKKDSRIVRIAHFSVQEYLASSRIRSSQASYFAMSTPDQRFRLCRTCLLYLDNEGFLTRTMTFDLIRQYPWSNYAAESWAKHYRQANRELVQQLSKSITRLFSEIDHLDHWLRLYDPLYEIEDNHRVVLNTFRPHPSPIYYAASLGLDDILVGLLSESTADIDAQGGGWYTALIAASMKGYTTTAQLLLDHGADVNAIGIAEPETTALIEASYWSREEIVELLLDKGANVNMTIGGAHGSALSAASGLGNKKIVELLLDQGAAMNRQTGQAPSALVMVCYSGTEETIELLLDRGTDIDIQATGLLNSALIAAAIVNSLKAVQLLLACCADANARGSSSTVLLVARRNHFKEIEELLLTHGAKESEDLEVLAIQEGTENVQV